MEKFWRFQRPNRIDIEKRDLPAAEGPDASTGHQPIKTREQVARRQDGVGGVLLRYSWTASGQADRETGTLAGRGRTYRVLRTKKPQTWKC
jgi:hypothetical protein